MKNADEVILTGCSAGGLGTYVHADYVASVVPQSAKFQAMADAGYVIPTVHCLVGLETKSSEINDIYFLCYIHYSYFLDEPNINGDMDIQAKCQYGM